MSYSAIINTCVDVMYVFVTLQKESFHWNLIFAISCMFNYLLNLNAAHHRIFANFSKAVYTVSPKSLL